MKKSNLRAWLIINLILFAGANIVIKAHGNFQELSVIYNNQGVEQTEAGQYGAAIESFRRALKLRPAYATAFFHPGIAFYRLKQFESARDALQKAVVLNPAHSPAHDQLGAVYVELQQYEPALNSFKTSIQLNPKNAVAFYNLGCAYIRLRRFKNALEALQQAWNLNSSEAETCLNLAYAYQQQAHYHQAIRQMQQCLALRPDDPEMRFYLGNLYLAVKDKHPPSPRKKYLAGSIRNWPGNFFMPSTKIKSSLLLNKHRAKNRRSAFLIHRSQIKNQGSKCTICFPHPDQSGVSLHR